MKNFYKVLPLGVLIAFSTLSVGISTKAPFVSAYSSVKAADFYTPKPGSLKRKRILNALRKPVQKDVGQYVKFMITELRVSGTWAYVDAQMLSKSGASISTAETDVVFGLLRKRGKRWLVVAYSVSPGDVAWWGWWKKYGAPRDLFPRPS